MRWSDGITDSKDMARKAKITCYWESHHWENRGLRSNRVLQEEFGDTWQREVKQNLCLGRTELLWSEEWMEETYIGWERNWKDTLYFWATKRILGGMDQYFPYSGWFVWLSNLIYSPLFLWLIFRALRTRTSQSHPCTMLFASCAVCPLGDLTDAENTLHLWITYMYNKHPLAERMPKEERVFATGYCFLS